MLRAYTEYSSVGPNEVGRRSGSRGCGVALVLALVLLTWSATLAAAPPVPAAQEWEDLSTFVPDPLLCAHPLLLSDLIKDVAYVLQREAIEVTTPWLSDVEEGRLGDAMHGLLGLAGHFVDDPQTQRYLEALLQRILPFTQRQLPWRIEILDVDESNAFAAPGGKIYITRGLLAAVDNEAQMIMVLAHEVAHHEGRHPGAAIQAMHALGLWNDDSFLTNNSLLDILQILSMPLSARQEQEADAFALDVVLALGYSPLQASHLMLHFAAAESDEDAAYNAVLQAEGERQADGYAFALWLLPELRNAFRTHPRAHARACAVQRHLRWLEAEPSALLYIGAANFAQRTPWSGHE